MQIIPVTTSSLASEFIHYPHQLYRKDPNWISPLDDDIRAVFDPKRNSFFSHGVCTRWLLSDGTKTIGRIAAFVNFEKARATHVGGVGFFECIDSFEAASMLFDT